MKIKKPTLKIVDLFILKTFLWAFLSVFSLFLVIGFVIVLFDDLDVMRSYGVSFGVGLTYILLRLPHEVVRATPFVVVLAMILGIGALIRSREMLMLFVAGYSPLRLSLPLSVAMGVIIVCTFVFNEYISGPFSAKAKYLRQAVMEGKSEGVGLPQGLWLFGDGDRVYRAEQSFTHKVIGLNIFEFTGDHKTIQTRLNAEEAFFKGDFWILKNVVSHQVRPDGSVKREYFDEQEYFLDKTPADFSRLIQHTEQMSHSELKTLVSSIQDAGEDPRIYLPDLRIKEAFPFAIFFLGLLTYSMLLRLSKGTRSSGIGLGLLAVIGYFLMLSLGKSFAKTGEISAAFAAWTPNLICLLLTLYFFYRLKEDI
jgi:LPS export ABC transporter permease LptG